MPKYNTRSTEHHNRIECLRTIPRSALDLCDWSDSRCGRFHHQGKCSWHTPLLGETHMQHGRGGKDKLFSLSEIESPFCPSGHHWTMTIHNFSVTYIDITCTNYPMWLSLKLHKHHDNDCLPNCVIFNSLWWTVTTWRFCQLFRTNSVAQEPEGSSPHSQQPATGPCPEPV
jgi:hypothetical protein